MHHKLPDPNGSWAYRETTPGEMRVMAYLEKIKVEDKYILHVGVGNSNLFYRFGDKNNIVGITVQKEEYDKATRDGNRTYLLDKYTDDLSVIGKNFDIIIDVNVKSFACHEGCYKHYLQKIISLLSDDGYILGVKSGWEYSDGDLGGADLNDFLSINKNLKTEIINDLIIIKK